MKNGNSLLTTDERALLTLLLGVEVDLQLDRLAQVAADRQVVHVLLPQPVVLDDRVRLVDLLHHQLLRLHLRLRVPVVPDQLLVVPAVHPHSPYFSICCCVDVNFDRSVVKYPKLFCSCCCSCSCSTPISKLSPIY